MYNDLIYIIALSKIPNIGTSRFHLLTKTFGSVKNVFDQSFESLCSIGLTQSTVNSIINPKHYLELAQQEIDYAEKHHIEILDINNPDYPQNIIRRRGLSAPLILYKKGKTNLNTRKYLSIVGTRDMTEYGREFCDYIIKELSYRHPEIVVVSGLARGVDAAAHSYSLEYGLETVAVVATGLNKTYPYEHTDLANRISDNGCLISEYGVTQTVQRTNFIDRNKITASIADTVLVVESNATGGSLKTAQFAYEYNVPLLALPGNFKCQRSDGCNNLLRENKASIAVDFTDIEKALDYIPSDNTFASNYEPPVVIKNEKKKDETKQNLNTASYQTDISSLSGLAQKIAECLKDGTQPLDYLVIQTGESVGKIQSELFDMEMDGTIESLPGNCYKLL